MDNQLVLKKLRNAISVFLYTGLILFFSWLASWETYLGYLGLLILFFGIIFWRLKGIKFLYIFLFPLFIFTMVLFPQSLNIYNQKTAEYMAKIDSGKDLSFKEKASIYGLNFFMCVIAFPIYPEVAKESFYLMFKTEDGRRVFEDDFFMESQKIKDGLKKRASDVSWNMSEYVCGNKESRYALALNPCNLSIKKFENFTEITVEVAVTYDKKTRAVLVNDPFEIAVEEGLFLYLQGEKWLHPYKAIWKTTVEN
ncbi:MAG: hypothetical protein ACK5BR_09920 [Bacteroidota bacterium]|jgi:hypothetical protein